MATGFEGEISQCIYYKPCFLELNSLDHVLRLKAESREFGPKSRSGHFQVISPSLSPSFCLQLHVTLSTDKKASKLGSVWSKRHHKPRLPH